MINLSSNRHNFNIIHLLYQQTHKCLDEVGFITFNNLLLYDNSSAMLKKIREVLIESNSKNTIVYKTNNFPNKEIQNKLIRHFENLYMFVPRDAGFFSVFNYLIGSLCRGYKLYPYFNKNMMEKFQNKIEHFCYLDTTIDNSWFHFFEPIRHFQDDTIHTDHLYKNFKVTGGEFANNEFTGPKHTLKLIKSNRFAQWRKATHQVLTNFIQVKSDISEASLQIFQKFKKQMIGVHFRNPSHWSEQGFVYLKDYFTKIDEILQNKKDIGIYLATDTDFGLAAFAMRYSDLIVYNQYCDRGSIDYFLSWVYNCQENKIDDYSFTTGIHNQKSISNNYSVSLGKDVLLDVILLAKCNYLVHTLSNISLAVSYWNPDCEMILLEGKS